MVLSLTPAFYINSSNEEVCSGVIAYELSRPKVTDSFQYGHLILFILFNVLVLISIVPLHFLQNTPHFRKVRPLNLTVITFLNPFCLSIMFLNLAIPTIPCGLLLFTQIFANGFVMWGVVSRCVTLGGKFFTYSNYTCAR
jgi:hypothetical protein